MKKQSLGPANCEGRNYDSAATANRFTDDFRQGNFGIAVFVAAIAVGRFDEQIVGVSDQRPGRP